LDALHDITISRHFFLSDLEMTTDITNKKKLETVGEKYLSVFFKPEPNAALVVKMTIDPSGPCQNLGQSGD
jgi:hypothetical protein